MPELDVVFSKGLDQRADKKTLPVGTPLTLDNYVYTATGRLVQRPGMTQELAPGLPVRRLIDTHAGVLALVDATESGLPGTSQVYRRSDTAGTWHNDMGSGGAAGETLADKKQRVPILSNVQRQVIFCQEGRVVKNHSMAVYTTYRFHAVETYDGTTYRVQFFVFDGDTLISQSAEYDNYRAPIVHAATEQSPFQWVVCCLESTGGASVIKLFRFVDPRVTSWSLDQTISLPGVVMYSLDFVWPIAGNYAFFAAGGDNTARWGRYNKTTGSSSSIEDTTAGHVNSIALSPNGLSMAWSLGDTENVMFQTFSNGTSPAATLTPAAVIFTGAGSNFITIGGAFWPLGSAEVLVHISTQNTHGIAHLTTLPGAKTQWMRVDTVTGETAALNSNSSAWGYIITGAPVCVGGREYWMVTSYLDPAKTVGKGMSRNIVLSGDELMVHPYPVLVGEPFLGDTTTPNESNGYTRVVPRAVANGYTLYFPTLEQGDDPGGANTYPASYAVFYKAEIGAEAMGVHVYDGTPGAVSLGGGVPSALEIRGSVEHVPLVYPIITAADYTTGTGLTGTFTYKAIYEIQDGLGRVGWSAVSPATAPVTLANSRMEIVVPNLYLTRLPNGCVPYIKIYRSDNGGPYQLLGRYPGARGTVDHVAVIDATADLSANEVLYTDSGEVVNCLPPFANALATYRNRVWCAAGNKVYYSKTLRSGFMPEWAQTFYVTLPNTVTAIAPCGEILVLFCEKPDAIAYVGGNGPDALGQGMYEPPQVVSRDIGAPSEYGGVNSVINVAHEVYFRSRRGIEKISYANVMKEQESSDLSKQIQDVLATTPIVVSTCHVPEDKQIYWSLRNSGGTSALVMYDYYAKTWHTFTGYGLSVANGLALLGRGGLLFTGAPYAVSSSNSGIWVSSSSAILDTTAASAKTLISTTLKLAPLRPFGLNGWGRIKKMKLLGEYRYPCTVTLTVSSDEGVTWEDTATATLTAADFAQGAVLDLAHKFDIQKCSSKIVSIVGVATNTTTGGQTPYWSGLTVEYDKLPGLRRPVAKEYL